VSSNTEKSNAGGNGQIITARITMSDQQEVLGILGQTDIHLSSIRSKFDVQLIPRGNTIIIKGEKNLVFRVKILFEELKKIYRSGGRISRSDVEYVADIVFSRGEKELDSAFSDIVLTTSKGIPLRPRTIGQKKYVQAVRRNDIVICIGPAGTGKTYLAVAMAVAALKAQEVSRVILVRPAVEAGETLGFLPGDFLEKIDPYFKPLYDAIFDMMDAEKFFRYRERGVIEIAPLAYMRGRTLNDSVVILDEAQNTTSKQMKMFLTRLGFGTKTIITGDITQVDLPRGTYSGLNEIQRVLNEIDQIKFVYLTEKDVVRHDLVQKIILAYQDFEGNGRAAPDAASATTAGASKED